MDAAALHIHAMESLLEAAAEQLEMAAHYVSPASTRGLAAQIRVYLRDHPASGAALVPAEPTPEMIDAGIVELESWFEPGQYPGNVYPDEIYRAMARAFRYFEKA